MNVGDTIGRFIKMHIYYNLPLIWLSDTDNGLCYKRNMCYDTIIDIDGELFK